MSFNALFLNEARAAGGLSHPHIVTVFDAGVSQQAATPTSRWSCSRAATCASCARKAGAPTPAQAALIVRRVADALAYAHSKGVVHRDIKPANIFMVGRTQPRVLDFGIARVAHQHESGATGDLAAGSPYYMAPEQARHETVDRRADVFSLGVVLYELLTDQKPFRGSHAERDHQGGARTRAAARQRGRCERARGARRRSLRGRWRRTRSTATARRVPCRASCATGSRKTPAAAEAAPVEPLPRPASRLWVLGGAVLAGLSLLAHRTCGSVSRHMATPSRRPRWHNAPPTPRARRRQRRLPRRCPRRRSRRPRNRRHPPARSRPRR